MAQLRAPLLAQVLGDQLGLFNWLLIIDHPWPAGLAPAGDDCVITGETSWGMEGRFNLDWCSLGEKWEAAGRHAGTGGAFSVTAHSYGCFLSEKENLQCTGLPI